MSRMYRESVKSLNWFVGCVHNCVYCEPSFQRQAKRSRKRCEKHYRYEPHAHLEKLANAPPKTVNGEFIFFPSLGDPCFASVKEFALALNYVEKYPNVTFLMQTKDPSMFLMTQPFPENLILCITLETNRSHFKTPSHYKNYSQISKAPKPVMRAHDFLQVTHKRKMVTIEPILDFDLEIFVDMLKALNPEIVYVGYDNHSCHLPEPRLEKGLQLIEELQKFTEVRLKTIRKAWYE